MLYQLSYFRNYDDCVKRRRLELPRHNCHYPLKVARLPIPPPLHTFHILKEQLPHLMCPEQDSNLHASRHTHLKRARLPIPPPGHIPPKDTDGAKNGTRTRDPNLGKVVLYQLSYFRNCECKDSFTFRFMQMVYYFFSSNKLLQNN